MKKIVPILVPGTKKNSSTFSSWNGIKIEIVELKIRKKELRL